MKARVPGDTTRSKNPPRGPRVCVQAKTMGCPVRRGPTPTSRAIMPISISMKIPMKRRHWFASGRLSDFRWSLGNWNLTPRGPHVTPSFYFGFTNDLLPIIVPWLQLNSLGLTILLHPNTEDPRADHLYYTLWVNRSQPVNAYGMKKPAPGQPRVERIFPNTKLTVKLEV